MMLVFDTKLETNLRNKLEALIIHQGKLRFDKKSANKSFNEQLKECESKIECVAQTLYTKDEYMLANEFDDYEIEVLRK